MAPKARAKSSARQRSTSAKAQARAQPKAASFPPARARVSLSWQPVRSDEVARAERLLSECLVEQEITQIDSRALETAVCEARILDSVDPGLLTKAEARLAEYRQFEQELQRRAEELKARKHEVIAVQEAENRAFADAVLARRKLQKQVEELFEAVEDSDLGKVWNFVYEHCAGYADPFGLPPLAVDLEDHEQNTPLSVAACFGELEIADFLIQSGAHPNARNGQGRTPLWRATYNGHENMVKFLLECGADPTIENTDGEPPGVYGTAGTKALLANWDLALTAGQQEGLPPLQRLEGPWPNLLLKACTAGDEALADEVIRAISAEAPDSTGILLRTVVDFQEMADSLWMACTKGHLEICRALLDAGADINSCTRTGLTCLMIACRKGHKEVAEELLSRGAKTHLRSEQGRLASDYARESGDGHQICQLVVDHCRKTHDWSTLEEEARHGGALKARSMEAVERLLDSRRNIGASNAATAALRALPVQELRDGSDRYRQLLEERALADVLGLG